MENTATAPADRVLSFDDDANSMGENADPAIRALRTPRLREIRKAQKGGGFVFPPHAFESMLVGCCGVLRSTYPLARRLTPDVLDVIESFAGGRISPMASVMLQGAAEDFGVQLMKGALVHAIHRRSACVHATSRHRQDDRREPTRDPPHRSCEARHQQPRATEQQGL